MSTRTLIFVTLSMVVVLTASYLQNRFFPAVPPQDPAIAEVAEVGELDPPTALAGTDQLGQTAEDPTSELGSERVDTGTQPPSALARDPQLENTTVDDGSEPGDGQADPAADDATGHVSDGEMQRAAGQVDPSRAETRFYTLGSLAKDSQYRFLVTFDAAGSSVRRVELNYRDDDGNYRYRDFEYRGGYLGELDCQTTPLGCRIRVVGPGTPAHAAGLKPGDVITAIEGEPITDAEDFREVMLRTRVGQTLEVALSRDTSPITTAIELTNKPIEVIRPDPDWFHQGRKGLPAFRTTLRVPTPLQEQWPEVDEQMMDAVWEVEEQTDQSITFSYTVTPDQIQRRNRETDGALDINGPLKITRRYSLTPVEDVSVHQKGARDFHINMDVSIENQSDQEQLLTWHLDGPTGLPTETWWFQNKIHGRNLAIGYAAGARDVIGSSNQEEFTFYGGPEIVANIQKTQPKYKWVVKPPAEKTDETQVVNYLSGDAQYFNVALLPDSATDPFTAYSVLADVADTDLPIQDYPKNVKEKRLVDCTFRMFKNIELAAGEQYNQSFEIFAGPKEPEILAAYDLGDVRIFGWFAMFSKPLCWLLHLFYQMTFQLSYGLAIILLTVLVRSLMIPISRKAAINAQMMQYLQPQMKELADKYKDDMEKRGQAQRELFRKYKYNPFGGCFMMFLQIPIFIGLYRGLSVDIALRDQPLIPGLSWCSNLAAPDQLWYWKETLPSFLGFLTDETGWLGPYLNILPIITCFLFIAQQKLFTPPPTDEQQEMMQKVMKYMMVFMGLLFFKVPSGLCLYFITSSLWGIAERKMLPKPELDKSRLDEMSDDMPDKATIKKLEKRKLQAEKATEKRQVEMDEKKRRDRERKKKLKQRGT